MTSRENDLLRMFVIFINLLMITYYLLLFIYFYFFIYYFFECHQINETSFELQVETILMPRTFAVLLCYLCSSERKA